MSDRDEREERVGQAVAWYFQAVESGLAPEPADFLARFPEVRPELESFLADKAAFDRAAGPPPDPDATLPPAPTPNSATIDHVPSGDPDSTLPPSPTSDATLPPSGSPPATEGPLGSVRYFGDYELLSEIARGGMGVVFKARQVSLNREVALKMILSGQLAGAADIARFHAEAEAAANLDHPNILPIYEVGEHHGQQYFAMKLAPGGSLAGKVGGLVQDPRAAAEVFAKVCRAVDFAHRRGILHRDLKPGNILLDADGTPYVTDFGLAKKVEGDSNLTQSGAIVGTPSYMAPEQARAEKGLTTAADVYALGGILYEFLTGQPPFRGPTVLDTILQVLEKEPADPRSSNLKADRDLSVIALKCLEKDPGKRYESAAALADDLDRWMAGEPILARKVNNLERVVKLVRRNPGISVAVAAAVLALVTFTTVLMAQVDRALAGEAMAKEKEADAVTARDEEKKRSGELKQERDKTKEAFARNERALTTSLVAQANVALRDHDPKLGLSILESCPENTRLWEWYYTRRLCRGAPLTLHLDSNFRSAVFSPDGLWIAATGLFEMSLIDARTGVVRWRVPGVEKTRVVQTHFSQLAFNPVSGRIAGWCQEANEVKRVWDFVVKVWDVRTGKELITIPAGKEGTGGPLVFSADGQWLACAGVNHSTTVWDSSTGKQKFAVPLKNAESFGNPGDQEIVQLAYVPGGGSLAVYDGEEVRFLDPLTGMEQPHRKIIARGSNAAFSPDGRHMAMKTEAARIRVLDLDTGTPCWDIPIEDNHAGAILKYSPDGERLAFMFGVHNSAWVLENVRLFDAATGKVLGTLPNKHWGPGDWPLSLSFSPDAQRLAVCHSMAVEVWNVRDLTDGLRLRGHTDTILAEVFSPDGRQLHTIANTTATTGSPAWELKRWDVDGGFAIATIPGATNGLKCAAFNPKADRVVVGGTDKTVGVCDAATGRVLWLIDLEGSPTDLAFGPGGDFVAVLVQEMDVSRILILDATSGHERCVIEPRKHLQALALTPDGQSVAGAVMAAVTPRAQDKVTFLPGTLERIQVWSVETGKEEWQIELPSNRVVTQPVLAFSPNGQWLASITSDTTVTLWNTQNREVRRQLKVPAIADKMVIIGTKSISDIIALTFSADSTRLATGGAGQTKVWDTHTGQEVYSSTNGLIVSRVAFRADDRALAVAGALFNHSADVLLLSAETVPSRAYLEGASTMAVFSPDGRLVAAAGPENEIMIYDAFTGQWVKRLEGHKEPIGSLIFSDDGKRLLSASLRDDVPFQGRVLLSRSVNVKEVKVWDLEKGNQPALFETLHKRVVGLALTADGSRVAAAFSETARLFSQKPGVSEIRVWGVADRQLVRAIPCNAFMDYGLMFADDDKVIAVHEGADKSVGWSVESGNPVKVNDNLSAKLQRDQRTEDGRRLWLSNGRYFIQSELNERQHKRLEAQGQPDPAWHAEKARGAEIDKQSFAASFHLGRLLLKSPGDVALLCRRAQTYIDLKQWKEARADCDKSIQLQPKSVEAWVMRGLLEYRQGHLEQALANLASAATIAPDDPAVAAWQAFLYGMDKQNEKAAAAEKRMWERLPFLLGVTVSRKDVKHRHLDLSAEIGPTWASLDEELSQRLTADAEAVPLLRLRGVVGAAKENPWGPPLTDWEEAKKLEQNDILVWKGFACAVWRVTRKNLDPARVKQGLIACDEVLRLDPKAWEFWYLRGLFCADDQQHVLAIEAYSRTLELHDNFALAFRERGAAHATLGHWTEAVRDLARAADLAGATDPSSWDLLALAQLSGDDPVAYKKTCTRMLELFGRTPPIKAADQRAADMTAVRCTILPDPLADWQRLVPLTKKSPEGVRGKVFYRTGRYDEAVKLLVPICTTPANVKAFRGELFEVPPEPTLVLTLYIALAEHRRGNTDQAKKILIEVINWLNEDIFVVPGTKKLKHSDVLTWTERVEIDQLRRELAGLLEDKVP